MLKAMVNYKTDTIIKNAGVNFPRMPPSLSSLRPHLRRVNYRVAQWKQSDEPHPAIPSPLEHGWCLMNGDLEPIWCDEEIVSLTFWLKAKMKTIMTLMGLITI